MEDNVSCWVYFEQPVDIKKLDLEFLLEDLETVKVIGKGRRGLVQLARYRWDGKLYALKVSF